MTNYSAKTKHAVSTKALSSRTSIKKDGAGLVVDPLKAVRRKRGRRTSFDDCAALGASLCFGGIGTEQMTRQMLNEYILQHKEVLEEIKQKSDISTAEKVEMLAKLSQSLSKTVDASRHVLPKTNRLVTALDVLSKLVQYTQQKHPERAEALLEVLEPFGSTLVNEYA